ncbi:MAG: DUF4292 domain-containing protein [Muribaculaceae bacterium]
MKKLLAMLAIATTLSIMGTSCSTTRRAAQGGSNIATETGLSQLAQFGEWQTLTTGGKVALGGTKSMSSSMQMKMVRGKSIAISIRPLLGIEMAKIYVSGDEIVIVDKYHKVYVREKASVLTSGVPVDVTTLQDILLGRVHILGKGTLSSTMANDVILSQEGNETMLMPSMQYEGFTYSYTFGDDRCVKSLNVSPVGSESIYSVIYDAIETTVAGKISGHTSVMTNVNGNPLELELTLRNLVWNAEFSDEIVIPEGYTEASGSSIVKALGTTVR